MTTPRVGDSQQQPLPPLLEAAVYAFLDEQPNSLFSHEIVDIFEDQQFAYDQYAREMVGSMLLENANQLGLDPIAIAAWVMFGPDPAPIHHAPPQGTPMAPAAGWLPPPPPSPMSVAPNGGPGIQGAPDIAGAQGLTAEQRANAEIIISVGRDMGASERDIQIALMTALQESSLKNLNYGDRDSLGLFQQRPSQGWGTPAQVTDPIYSSRKFYQGLMALDDRNSMALTQAAQAVQRSAYPDAYAKWQGMAAGLMIELGQGVPSPA